MDLSRLSQEVIPLGLFALPNAAINQCLTRGVANGP